MFETSSQTMADVGDEIDQAIENLPWMYIYNIFQLQFRNNENFTVTPLIQWYSMILEGIFVHQIFQAGRCPSFPIKSGAKKTIQLRPAKRQPKPWPWRADSLGSGRAIEGEAMYNV